MEYDQTSRESGSQPVGHQPVTRVTPTQMKSANESTPAALNGPNTAVRIDRESVVGCLLGTAGGDSVALPLEGLSPRRASKLYAGPLRQRLIFGRGMVSDDTEHAALLARSLLKSGDNPSTFRSELGKQIRNWVACLPAGIGLGTLRAGIKLGVGVSPANSGVNSAGNGPCMRSPLLGVLFGHDPHKLLAYVDASTRITHKDERALSGALAIAVATYVSSSAEAVTPQSFLEEVKFVLNLVEDENITKAVTQAVESVLRQESTQEYASSLGLSKGVSGFVMHTVPVCIHAWLRNPDNYSAAVEEVVRCGGDADTTGAIVGAIVGARVKKEGIPQDWLASISDPYVNPRKLQEVGQRLSERFPHPSVNVPSLGHPLVHVGRNFYFAGIVLAHGFRRLLPPY